MRSTQTVFLALLGTMLAIAGYIILHNLGILWGREVVEVKAVPEGCHEIAWIGLATSTETWERMVEAVEQIKNQWPPPGVKGKRLKIDLENAFPPLTAGVAEVALWVEGQEEQKVLLRWYKISSENPIKIWVRNLSKRSPPPLAIIGGETTSRAMDLSKLLKDSLTSWQGRPPLFLISTATADAYSLPKEKTGDRSLVEGGLQLMDIYKGRNYRFSFTNTLMAQAVLDFVQEHEGLWSRRPCDPGMAAAVVTATNGFTRLALLQAEETYLDYAMYGVAWDDDEFSKDLRDRFLAVFQKRFFPETPREKKPGLPPVGDWLVQVGPPRLPTLRLDGGQVLHSTGDQFHPGPQDVAAALLFHKHRDKSPRIRQLLALPTGADRARRYLKALLNTSPQDVQNIVVLSGDSITLNHVYRDRKMSWNILDLPIPLVSFSHRNPVDEKAGFREEKPGSLPKPPWATTGTQDVLFYRDLLEAVVLAVYRDGQFVADSEDLNRRLEALRWVEVLQEVNGKKRPVAGRVTYSPQGQPLFDENRNRREGTGEHVILVQPHRFGDIIEPSSTVTVWARRTDVSSPRHWELVRNLNDGYVYYIDPKPLVESDPEEP